MKHLGFLFAVTISAGLTGCWEGVSRQVQARVLSLRGPVTWASAETSQFRPLDLKIKLGPNSIIKTADRAQISLALLPGALLQLSANSELQIEALKLTKNGDETDDGVRERVARIQLKRGAIIVSFEGTARFTIQSAHATITVTPDCLFRLQTDEHQTRLTCVRGKVWVSPHEGEPIPVGAGYVQEWPSGQIAAVAEDRPGQPATADLTKAERELLDLAAAQRYRLPF